MKYSVNALAFKTRVRSWMKDDLSREMLVLMMENICTNVKISKEIIHVLLEELMIYKITKTGDLGTKAVILVTNSKQNVEKHFSKNGEHSKNTVNADVLREVDPLEQPETFDIYMSQDFSDFFFTFHSSANRVCSAPTACSTLPCS